MKLPEMKAFGPFYILDDEHRPVEVDFLTAAVAWGEDKNRQIACESVGDLEISTIFLPFNHGSPRRKGPPYLFETMVFRDGEPVEQKRYVSWDDAMTGHAAIVRRCQNLIDERSAAPSPPTT